MRRALGRREFLATAGTAGLTLLFAIPTGRRARPASAAGAFEPNAWLTIAPDGAITVHITRAEMGQGIGTALAQIVAEELEADWQDVRIDYPVNDPKYGMMATIGSLSVGRLFSPLARAGAAARIALVEAAAQHWKADAADCVAERGVVRHRATGRSIAYGELVARVPITKTLTPDELNAIALKKPDRYTVIGRSIPRLDIPAKVDGSATYGIDVFLPGMAYAKVAYPPTRAGGTHRAVDDEASRKVRGYLKTVVTADLVAVVAETYEAAVEARDALKITWDRGLHAGTSSASIALEYERLARREAGIPWVSLGDATSAMQRAARTHAATYTTDFAEQAPMEPMNCVARWVGDRCELFTGTQGQSFNLLELSRRLGVAAASIHIHQQLLGGGFGRRQEADAMVEAALIARAAGRPIKLIRSREEDFARSFSRTPTLHAMKAGLDGTGKVVAWEHAVVGASPFGRAGSVRSLDSRGLDFTLMAGANHLYDIPDQLVRQIRGEHGIPIGQYRAVGGGYNSFAIEAFLDEVAHLAGTDPLAIRLGLAGRQPRLANVLRLAAAKAGWGTPLPPNVGRGLAATTYGLDRPTWTALVVQAGVDRASGTVRVDKMICVVDCGLVINPDGAHAQLEGGLLYGLSAALKERGTLSRGAFDQKNFEDYPILRIDEVPEVEIHLVESTEAPTGTGEPTTTVVAPAISNAIFAATGARVRQLPFLPDRVLKALRDKS